MVDTGNAVLRVQRRRKRIIRFVALGLLTVATVSLCVQAFIVEPDMLLVRDVAVATSRWPSHLPPLRLVAMSDIHAGSAFIDAAKLDQIVERVATLQPDVIFLLGDYLAQDVLLGQPMAPEVVAQHLGRLRAPLGVYAVLGNHDWTYDGERVWRALEQVGIVVLENRAVPLPGLSIWVAGLADDTTRKPDPERAFAAIPDDAAVIALAHDPALFSETAPRAALTLAGHTHGGQVALPLIGPLYIPTRAPLRYAYGHIREGGADLYVTSGIGTTVIPVRFNMPPEVAVITLHADPSVVHSIR